MLEVTKPYICPICNKPIETYLINTVRNKFVFVCSSCKRSYELTEDEYLKSIKKGNK